MEKLEKSIKIRYFVYVSIIVLVISTVLLIIQKNVNNQKHDTYLINKSNQQQILSQSICKSVYSIYGELDDTFRKKSIQTIENQINELQDAHELLLNNNLVIDSLLKLNEPNLILIESIANDLIKSPNYEITKHDIDELEKAESAYLNIMSVVVDELQKASEAKQKSLINTFYLLAFLSALILIGEFFLVLAPAFKKLFQQNKSLKQANKELVDSENKIKEQILELNKLKQDLELKDANNRVFIEQAPTAIALLDKNMHYLAVSKRWISDYKLQGKQIIGRSHYDIFPEIGEDWKRKHQECLNGVIDTCEEAQFIRANGSVQWIFWDVRPWYNSDGTVGGLIMHTGDITHQKEKEEEIIQTQKILEKTNEIARIGAWEINVAQKKLFWSKIVKTIHEVPEDYEPELQTAINFYKEGESRDLIKKLVKDALENGKAYDVEVQLVTFKGKTIWTRAIGQADFVDGKCIRIYGMFQDINEVKLAQIALNSAHNQLKAIFNSNLLGIVTTDSQGIIKQFNKGAEILTGYLAEEVIDIHPPSIYHHQYELDQFRIEIAKKYNKNPIGFSAQLEMSKHNTSDTREWNYLRKDGTSLPVQLTLTSIKDENENLIGYLGISSDISEKRIAQNELFRKNQLLNFAEEITLMGNWQWDYQSDIMKWSKNIFNILDIDTEIQNLNFDTYFKVVHPDDTEKVKSYFKNAAEVKMLKRFSHRIITKDGQIKIIQILGEVICNQKGEVIEMIGSCQDITEIKAAEKELYEANVQLRAIFNSGPIAIVSTNNQGIINHFNSGAEALLGYSASEMIGQMPPEVFHIEEELDNFRIEKAKEYGLDPNGFDPYLEMFKRNKFDTREWTYRRKDGSTFPVQVTLTAIKNEKGEKIGYLGVSFDITERRIAQNELLRKNQILNFAEKITKIGNWQTDIINNTIVFSNNLYHILGLSEDIEASFDTFLDVVHPEDREKVAKHRQESLRIKKFNDLVHRLKLSDGTIKIVQLRAEFNFDNKGNITELIGTCQDVTAQRMAENKFRGLLESAPDAIVIVNDQLEIQLINKQAEKLFGYSSEELLNKPVGILIPERYSELTKEFSLDFFSNPRVRGMGEAKEFYGLNKNGIEIPVQISFSPLQTEEGLLVSAAIRDITEQKIAENELLRKNQLLTFAEKITMMGNWQWNINTNVVKWSANLYNIFGIEVNTDLTYDTYFSFVHPEDKKRVTIHIDRSIIEKKFIDLMHRILLKNGKVKTIQLLAEVVTDNLGNVIELIGTCQDVTEQRMAENKFRGLLESAPDAIVIVNERGKIQLINKQAEKLFGYAAIELFDKSVEILIPGRFKGNHPGHRDGFFSKPKAREMGQGKDLFGINKNGEEIPIQISLSPLQTEEGLLVSAAIRDITEQKLAEGRIIEAKDRLEALANKLTYQNAQLAEFAHITSHNLRAPVSNLNSLLEYYHMTNSDEDRVILFEKFEKVIHHLTLTLNTLVEALKTKNDIVQNTENISFNEVLEITKEILYSKILKAGAIIKSDFSSIGSISCNRIYLESIFLNLLSNAIKYRSVDRVPEIYITSEKEDNKLRLSFKDNGVGIDLVKNGDKLFGLNKVFHRHPEALGVGLFITKAQVEAMGGKISAKSKVNEGSTFCVEFKLN